MRARLASIIIRVLLDFHRRVLSTNRHDNWSMRMIFLKYSVYEVLISAIEAAVGMTKSGNQE